MTVLLYFLTIRPQKDWFSLEYTHNSLLPGVLICHCPIHAPCDPKWYQGNSTGGCWCPGSGSHFVCHNSGSCIIHVTLLTGQLVRYQCLGESRWHEQVLKIKIPQGVVQVKTCGVSPGCWMKNSSKQVLCSKAPEWHTLYLDNTSHASAKINDFFSVN